jgi:hypothetical protein
MKPDHAGLRKWARARQTGRIVAVYDGEEAMLDTAGGRWQTVCEDHGFIVAHNTLALALSHSADPLGWCEVCRVEAGLQEPWDGPPFS